MPIRGHSGVQGGAEMGAYATSFPGGRPVDADGAAELVATGGGLDAAIGRLVAIAYRAQLEGTWQRLKACPEATCTWAFYDRSRNRSSTWCSMAVCGNRAKARKFRERHSARGARRAR
jgi:predicted RNA-binding Zn ribbon-like protein